MNLERELEKLIRAFPPHPLHGSAFEEWGGTHLDAEKFSAAVQGKQWNELEREFLEYHYDAAFFFGPSSVADYLPAYLLAMLKSKANTGMLSDSVLSILTRREGDSRFDERYRHLTALQRRTVAEVLAAYETAVKDTPQQADVSSALDNYWRSKLE